VEILHSCCRLIESAALDQSRLPDVSSRHRLLENMATSYSLLEFHKIPGNCTSNSTSDGLDGDFDDEDDLWSSIRTPDKESEEDGEEAEGASDAVASEDDSTVTTTLSASAKSNTADKPKEKEKGPGKHPYILTRYVGVPILQLHLRSRVWSRVVAKLKHPRVDQDLTIRSHLFLINETRLLDRKAFDKKHKHLLDTSCGRPMKHVAPSWMMCNRDYAMNGNWETRMALLPEREGGRKELAYGPYVGRLKHSAGPKVRAASQPPRAFFGIREHAHLQDVVKIPVSREVCDGKEPDRKQSLCMNLDRLLTMLGSLDPKTLHVKHHIKFSTLTPARLNVLETFATSERVSHNATEASIIHSHDSWRQTGASTSSSSKPHGVGTYSSGRLWRSPRGRTSMAPPHPDRNRVSRMHAAGVDARATSRLPRV